MMTTVYVCVIFALNRALRIRILRTAPGRKPGTNNALSRKDRLEKQEQILQHSLIICCAEDDDPMWQ